MRLYVMRHGIAVDRADPECPPDADRPLTPDGVERTRLALHGLVTLGISIERIYTSTYLRAAQTAALASEALGVPRMNVQHTALLHPDGDVDDLVQLLRGLDEEPTLCVGHSPHVDTLVARLLGVPTTVTSLKKAGIVALDLKKSSDRARIVAVYEPKALRELGRAK